LLSREIRRELTFDAGFFLRSVHVAFAANCMAAKGVELPRYRGQFIVFVS
jgi:hypothetical protein